MTSLALVTAAHPYWSGIGIWIGCSVIAAGLWALCKQRDDEDVYERRSPDGDGLPMEKGLGEGRDNSRVSVVETGECIAAIGQRTGTLGLVGGSAVHRKPAAGSEPADAHTNARRTTRPARRTGALE